MEIDTKTSETRELEVKSILEEILKTYPCPIFTDKILIEKGSIPHSHPILTLNTRNLDPLLIAETFVHEQFHWFASSHVSYKDSIEYLKKYPDLGDCNKSGKYPDSFWEHLIVIWNTENFIQRNFTKDEINFIHNQWQPYPLTEKFVEENFTTLRSDLLKFDMVYQSMKS